MNIIISEIEKLINFKILHLYSYGSRVYGCNKPDSDFDFIIITNQNEDKIDSIISNDGKINATLYSLEGFKKAIDNHEISVLEAIFLEKNFIWDFDLDINKLRHSISQKSSNSFVKAKKKLIDNEIIIAKKSLFHSLRMILFGIQIVKFGKINDYSEANYLFEEIINSESEWILWKEKYGEMRNKLMSEFRILAPKK